MTASTRRLPAGTGAAAVLSAAALAVTLSAPGARAENIASSVGAAADTFQDDTGLRLLAAAEISTPALFETRATAFLQAAGCTGAAAGFSERMALHRFVSSLQGVDPKRPILFFHLLPETATSGGAHVALLPVADKGAAFLGGLSRDYAFLQTDGPVTTAGDPKNASFPECVFFAATGPLVIASDNYEAVRWATERLRDRDLPTVAESSHPLRISIEPGVLAESLEALAASPELMAGLRDNVRDTLRDNLSGAAELARNLAGLDIAIAASTMGLDIEITALGKPRTPFAAAAAVTRNPLPFLDAELPGKVFLARWDTFPLFLKAGGEPLAEWADKLAGSWSILGFRFGPLPRTRTQALLAPLAGDRLDALVAPPGLSGIVRLQAFSLRDPAAMEARLAELLDALRAADDFPGAVCDDFLAAGCPAYRVRIDNAMAAERTDQPVAGRFDLNDTLMLMSRKTHLEMAVAGNLLVLAHGPEGSLEALLPALLDRSKSGQAARRARLLLPSDIADGKGVSVYAPSSYIRALAALAPDVQEASLVRLPDTGDGIAACLSSPSPASLRWTVRLTTREVGSLHRIFTTQSQLLQDIILQVLLEPLRSRVPGNGSDAGILAPLSEGKR